MGGSAMPGSLSQRVYIAVEALWREALRLCGPVHAPLHGGPLSDGALIRAA